MRNIGKNDIQLRNFDQLRLSHANLSTLDLFPWYNFPYIWQEFPDEQIKIICKPSEFDAKLKNYFLSDLESIVVCNRLFCPACRQAAWDNLNYIILFFPSLMQPLSLCVLSGPFGTYSIIYPKCIDGISCPSPLKFADPRSVRLLSENELTCAPWALARIFSYACAHWFINRRLSIILPCLCLYRIRNKIFLFLPIPMIVHLLSIHWVRQTFPIFQWTETELFEKSMDPKSCDSYCIISKSEIPHTVVLFTDYSTSTSWVHASWFNCYKNMLYTLYRVQ